MRIVHLTYALVTGYDPESWLKRINFFVLLLERMAMEADTVSVHLMQHTKILERNKVKYHFLKCLKFQLAFPAALHRYIRDLRPDIVLIHGFHFPWQVSWLRLQLGSDVSIVVQHHSEVPLRHYKKFLQRLIDKTVSAYFFPSFEQAEPWVRAKQIESLGKVQEVMEVPSIFHPIDRAQARERSGVKEGVVYLWVGRFDSNKDPLTLVKAFISFARQNQKALLYVVFQSEELLGEINRVLQKASDVKDQIILVGKIGHEDLLYWFNSADFIISTSHYEGMGVAISEAMSCGCIPILTNIPSFRKMTENGTYGLLYGAGSADDLYEAFKKSEALNITSVRENVLYQYKMKLSAEAICEKMISVFKTLLKN